MVTTIVIWSLLFGSFYRTDAACTFSSDIQNSVWDSTEFGEITFWTTDAGFIDAGQTTSSNWTCQSVFGSTYILTSLDSATSASLGTDVYFFYCFAFYHQTNDSYLYYHPTDADATGVRRLLLATATTSYATACTATVDTAEYHVMVKRSTGSSVQKTCVDPFLGNFLYSCSSGSTDNGTINVCNTTSPQTTLTFNHSQCASPVLYSDSGVLNCVANTHTTISSETVYYQTLYNTDTTVNDLTTRRFVCLAVTQASNGTVFFSYNPLDCVSGQTSTSATKFEPLISTGLCPIVVPDPVIINSNKANLGLIIGIAIGLLVLLIIIGALVFYFCIYKRDPNAGKPIVENTKPRFEDPDKDDIIEDLEMIDTRSTPVTRDEIIFEAMSPNLIPNGKIPNGNPITSSPTGTHPGSFFPGGMMNGSFRRDSGIAMTEKSNDRPTPRIGLNPTKESMVIFNGDEKVISGNDTRIVPNENPNARTFKMNNSMNDGGPLTLLGLENEEDDELGELSPHSENILYSVTRENLNLMPPIETTDPEKEKDAQ